MAIVKEDHFEGGRNLTPKGSGGVPGEDLAGLLRTSAVAATPNMATGLVVAGDAYTHSGAAWVVQVEATTATSAGPKQIVSGAPAAGQVQVSYSAAGVPTLTFNGTDAVTAAAATLLPGHSAG